MICSMQVSAACTGIYVGKDASADGSIIIARSNDYRADWGNHITITPHVDNSPGRFMPVSADGEVKTEIPATTYKYTATPYMDSAHASDRPDCDAAACTNEYGVSMTMSVSAHLNNESLKADPLVEGGLAEASAADLVVCQSKTAREAVEVLLGIVDKYGNAESNIAIIADQNEVWYVELYGGHQYAAVKMPNDKVAVFGNEFSLEYLSDYEDSITSADLTKLPEENGFAVKGRNGEINLFETYAGTKINNDTAHMRTWEGHRLLEPSKYSSDYDRNAMYPLAFKPDKKVSVQDVAHILRDRYEGTPYSPDEAGRNDTRAIGSDETLSAHIIQVFSNLPSEMSCVSWISCGPPVYGVFVPVSNDCVNVSEAYGANQPANDTGVFDTGHYPYYVSKGLCTQCMGPDNYNVYGKPVQAYWNESEGYMFSSMGEVLSKAAQIPDNNHRANYLTSYCNDVQTKAFNDAKEMLNEVISNQNANNASGRSMELKLDASQYQYVPDVPADAKGLFGFLVP
ncbi:C69 family dipeptidase [Methanobrevibacter sp.]|uniref:C69 family dipeptidase n=1 Tax=Methanobrevibacter sp. TaxID=66852 RepID=UPI002600C35E|nr:C69 family dipeptidase [Methanobrevibacter sp.]